MKHGAATGIAAGGGVTDSLLERLADVVGSQHVLTGGDVSARATHFWNAAPLVAGALVRPGSTEQTSRVLTLCHEAGQAVVTHGGVTGLVEGDRSTADDIILSMERMRAIDAVDVSGRSLIVEAGAILQDVQQAANEAGLQFGLDLGARGSCTIGGNIATNAGGLSVLRYGMTREQILGLEVVLADGTVLSSMNRMMKNNAGYDLKHLFVGSEGTLGVITRAVLRLRAATPAVETCLLAFDSFNQVTDTLHYLSGALDGTLNAFEVIWQPFYRLNTDPGLSGTSQSPLSRDHAFYAIAESRGADSEKTSVTFQQVLEHAMSEGLISDAVIAQSERERRNFWHIREHFDSAMQNDPVFVYDISLPIVAMNVYVETLHEQLQARWPGVILYVYGHLADGNLHILVAPASPQAISAQEQRTWHELSNALVYGPLQKLGGSVSAEHGIGLTKKAYLSLSRTPAEIELMRVLKKTLDPLGLLNPGKIV